MELKKLLQEVQSIKEQLEKVDYVISYRDKHGIDLVIAVANNLAVNATADIDFLYEALLTQREVLIKRKEKLSSAVEVAQKVVAGLLAE